MYLCICFFVVKWQLCFQLQLPADWGASKTKYDHHHDCQHKHHHNHDHNCQHDCQHNYHHDCQRDLTFWVIIIKLMIPARYFRTPFSFLKNVASISKHCSPVNIFQSNSFLNKKNVSSSPSSFSLQLSLRSPSSQRSTSSSWTRRPWTGWPTWSTSTSRPVVKGTWIDYIWEHHGHVCFCSPTQSRVQSLKKMQLIMTTSDCSDISIYWKTKKDGFDEDSSLVHHHMIIIWQYEDKKYDDHYKKIWWSSYDKISPFVVKQREMNPTKTALQSIPTSYDGLVVERSATD